MDPRQPVPPEPSPVKNYVSGGGCGCGCLGALIVLVGAIILGGIPLGFYQGDTQGVIIAGIAALLGGLLTGGLGIAMWAGSLFMD